MQDYYINNTTAIINIDAILVTAHKRHTELVLFYDLINKANTRDSNKILLACILQEFINLLKAYVVKPMLFYKQNTITNLTHEKILKQICKVIGIVVIDSDKTFEEFVQKIDTDEIKILISKKLNEKYSSPPRNLNTVKRLLVKNNLTFLHNSIFKDKYLKSVLLK